MLNRFIQFFQVRRKLRNAFAIGSRVITLTILILCLIYLWDQYNLFESIEDQLRHYRSLLGIFVPTYNSPLDAQGCHPILATSHFALLHAKSLEVDTVVFSAQFKDFFSFDHTSSNWAGFTGSGVWIESEQTFLISTRLIYKPAHCENPCVDPEESFIYLQALDTNYNVKKLQYETKSNAIIVPPEGRIVDIYGTSNLKKTKGPEDARMNLDGYGNPILSFNMADQVGRRYYSYNLTRGNLQHLVPGNDWDTKQKNWAPFFSNGAMHYVYSFNPLRILRCDRRETACSFISGKRGNIPKLRGGTPLIRHKATHYYVGLARTYQKGSCGRTYRPNIVVLYIPPDDWPLIDLVYVSEDINFNNTILRPPFAPPGLDTYCDSYLIPSGFLRWTFEDEKNSDISYFIFSIQDAINVIVEAKGLEKVVKSVITITETRRHQYKTENKPWSSMGPALVRCAEKRLYSKFLS